MAPDGPAAPGLEIRAAGAWSPSDTAVLLLCALAIFADVLLSGAVIPNIPAFAERFGARELGLGLATSAFSAAFLAAVVPLGILVDRTGRSDLILLLAMIAVAAGGLLFAFGGALWTYAIGQGLHGAGSAGAWVGAQPVAARLVEGRRRRGLLMSSVTIALGLGLVFGPLLGSISPLWIPFVIVSLVALAIGVGALVALAGVPAPSEPLTGVYRQLLRNPLVLAAAAIVLLLYAAVSMMEILFPLYADGLGASKAAIGLLFLLYALFLTGSQPIVAPVIDRVRRGVPEAVSLLALALGLVGLVATADYPAWAGLFGLMGVATGVLVSASMLTIAGESPPFARGGAFALWNMAFAIGFLIGPPVGGALSQLANGGSTERFRLPFLTFAALLAMAGPLLWSVLRRPSGRRHD